MCYLLKRSSRYYYNRRIPDIFRNLDPRGIVRVSLQTDSLQQARRRAILFNDKIEAYWKELAASNERHCGKKFDGIVRTAQAMGFAYQPMNEIAGGAIEEIVRRVLALSDASKPQIEAVLGTKEEPCLTISQACEQFWDLAKEKVIDKSPDQIRKWKNPRLKAIENFIAVVGNKELKEITRDDTVRFKDWWISRIQDENKEPGSANKDFIHVKSIIDLVSEHHRLGLDIPHLFKKIKLNTILKQKRLPFTAEQIKDFLGHPKLKRLNDNAYWFLYAAAGTGARPSELIGLLPEDIHLSTPIPYISIRSRKGHSLKTPHSERDIPLLGYGLQAFQAKPEGFPYYSGRPDNLTNSVNKFLREHKILPSKQHSVYSFRHSFQDGLLRVNAPDRVQAELMGHKFSRPKYGDGATLVQKKEWMEKFMNG